MLSTSMVINDKRKRIAEKKSVGIACCRFVNNIPQILLVCKRVSYGYSDFIVGKYNSYDNASIIKLLSNMTVDEKICIMGLDFIAIWHRVWLDYIPKHLNFFSLKAKFEIAFVRDHGTRLRNLIALSTSVRPLWEIPKGRVEKNEYEVNCAIREFKEETGISKKNYKLLLPAHKYQTIVDNNIRYISKYFIALAGSNVEPNMNLFASQVTEILDIRWMNINEVKLVDENNRLYDIIKPILNYAKKHKNRLP